MRSSTGLVPTMMTCVYSFDWDGVLFFFFFVESETVGLACAKYFRGGKIRVDVSLVMFRQFLYLNYYSDSLFVEIYCLGFKGCVRKISYNDLITFMRN